MGTNYYAEDGEEKVHIGKLSVGWEFMFHASENGPQSWQDWKVYLHEKKIVDEYEKKVSFRDFIRLVESTKYPGARNHTRYCRQHYKDDHSGRLDPEGWSFTFGCFS